MRIPSQAHSILNIYQIFWPPTFHVKIGGEVYEIGSVNLFPRAKEEQSSLLDIDKNKRSEYDGKRDPTLG